MTESNRTDLQQHLFEPELFQRGREEVGTIGPGVEPRFLILDDEPEGRAFVSGIIQSRYPAAVIREAATNAEAFRVLLNFAPDIIVTELSRKGGAGYEFLRKLRQCPRLTETPVVLSSRRGREADAFGISVEGIHEAACKRVSQEAMMAALFASLLGRGERSRKSDVWVGGES